MKRAIYDSLYMLDESFEQIPESLEKLRDLGVVTPEYVESQRVRSEELRAEINFMILNKLQTREEADRLHFGKMRFLIVSTDACYSDSRSANFCIDALMPRSICSASSSVYLPLYIYHVRVRCSFSMRLL